MNLRNFLGVAGVLGVLGGLPFLFLPAQTISVYGLSTDAGGLLMTRFFGAAFFSFGVLLWYVRDAIDPDEHRYVLVPLMICALVGVVITLIGQLSGLVNPIGWSAVVLFAVFAVGFGLYSRR